MKKPAEAVDIVFDGPPGPVAGRFVEVESPPGKGINFGEWVERADGYWVLRIAKPPAGDAELVEDEIRSFFVGCSMQYPTGAPWRRLGSALIAALAQRLRERGENDGNGKGE